MFQTVKSWNNGMHHLKKKHSPNLKPFLCFIDVKRTVREDKPMVSANWDYFDTWLTHSATNIYGIHMPLHGRGNGP